MECVMCKEQSGGAKSDPWLTADKEMGPQLYKCKEMNSTNDMNDFGSTFFLTDSIK